MLYTVLHVGILAIHYIRQQQYSIWTRITNPSLARDSYLTRTIMYCLQWLIPVLLIPLPKSLLTPAILHNHTMFIVLYLTSFVLERKPCAICSIVFVIAVALICYSCYPNCAFILCDRTCDANPA